jgi:hypothetical protein
MECWRANFNFRLTLDLGMVVDYMTKYVTKAESLMTPSATRRNHSRVNCSRGSRCPQCFEADHGETSGRTHSFEQGTGKNSHYLFHFDGNETERREVFGDGNDRTIHSKRDGFGIPTEAASCKDPHNNGYCKYLGFTCFRCRADRDSTG